MKKNKILLMLLWIVPLMNYAQIHNVDKTIAIVGKEMIKRSDVEDQLLQMKANDMVVDENSFCAAFEELLYQKLLVAIADKDSVTVTDAQVDTELDRRMNYFLGKYGSEEMFQQKIGKTSAQYKESMRPVVKDQLIAQQMQSTIVGNIKVNPAEVKQFYATIPSDSLPTINSEVEVGVIVRNPSVSAEAKAAARKKIEEIRAKIVAGDSKFSTQAILYSEDPGSARNGGLYKGINRGTMVPEFETVAFRLKPGEVSEVFETPYGYHILETISRRGDEYDARHILIAPKVDENDVEGSKNLLDSIYDLISTGKITFCAAAAKYSDDKDTRNNCGTLSNPAVGSTRFDVEQLGQYDNNLLFMLNKMNVGDVSKPVLFQTQDNKQAYRMVLLKSRSEPHILNLKDDYGYVQTMTISDKQKRIVNDWINKKTKGVYIKIDTEYKNCTFKHNWLPLNK